MDNDPAVKLRSGEPVSPTEIRQALQVRDAFKKEQLEHAIPKRLVPILAVSTCLMIGMYLLGFKPVALALLLPVCLSGGALLLASVDLSISGKKSVQQVREEYPEVTKKFEAGLYWFRPPPRGYGGR